MPPVTVVVASAAAQIVTADCGPDSHAIAGGGSSLGTTGSGGNMSSNFQGSFPSEANGAPVPSGSQNPRFWTTLWFEADPTNTTYALCVPN
jgi:hypothetical protein